MKVFKKVVIGIICFILFINLLFLDWKFFSAHAAPEVTQNNQTMALKQNSQSGESTNGCSVSCQNSIYQAIYNSTSSATTPQTGIIQTEPSSPKEYFVPFGSATWESTQWADAPGLQAYVDTGNYARIKQVFFEVSVYVPTGNETVNIQLYDASNMHPVWNSNVYFNSGTTPQLLISSPLTLDPGNNLYIVQMQTQLTFPAVLDQARLHIITYD